MIAIDMLTVSFGGVYAIDELTLDLRDDVVGIIGPNGAGKTTLINVLSGFVEPRSGGVMAFDNDLLAMKPHERARWGLARSFQKAQISPDLNVEDHIRVALDFQGLPERDNQKVLAHVTEFTGLSEHRHDPGRVLNSAQQRLTEIARCLASSPKIVLLDEPGGGLPQNEMRGLQELIGNIKREFDAMVVLIDHDVDLIRAVCSHMVVLDFGRLIALGETNTVLSDEKVKAAYLGR